MSERSRLISDVLKITKSLDIEGSLMAVDIEKTLILLIILSWCACWKNGFGNEFWK